MLDALRERYPWPKECPWPDQEVWDLGSRGRGLIADLIVDHNIRCIIEVGSFVGGSAKIWLETSPTVTVIAIDPWEGEWWVDYATKRGKPVLAQRFAESPLRTFMSALWKYRDRVIPVKGSSPDKLYEIHALGIQPGAVYFDAMKDGADFEVAMKLFPEAVICGDDWTWGISQGYPARKAARALAEKYGKRIRVSGETWVLSDSLTASDLLRLAASNARDIARRVKHVIAAPTSH